jgi:hypothetical protein
MAKMMAISEKGNEKRKYQYLKRRKSENEKNEAKESEMKEEAKAESRMKSAQ